MRKDTLLNLPLAPMDVLLTQLYGMIMVLNLFGIVVATCMIYNMEFKGSAVKKMYMLPVSVPVMYLCLLYTSWNGFDEGALETVSEYLQENGTTLYDLTEFPKDSVVTLRSGQTLTIEEIQAVQKDIWEETMAGKNESGTDVRFNFHAVSEVQLPEGIKLKMPEIHYIDNFYVMEDVNAEGVVKVNRRCV